MLVFHFIFDLLWRGRGSSVTSSVLGLCEQKEIEKYGYRQVQYSNPLPSVGFPRFLHLCIETAE